MTPFAKLSEAGNAFLQEIHDQLPVEAQYLFENCLSNLTRPSASEYVFQAVVNKLATDELLDLLDQLCSDGDLEQDLLRDTAAAYPSILTRDIYNNLLHHFKE